MIKPAAVGFMLGLSVAPALAQSEAAAAARRESAGRNWIYTETASPLDDAPVVIASAWASERGGPVVQLSIQCRRGRTELVIGSPAMRGRAEDHRVTYSVNGGAAQPLPVGAADTGNGIALNDDVVGFLTGLPAEGEVTFEVTNQDAPLIGSYALAPVKTVLDRLAGPCNWPGILQ